MSDEDNRRLLHGGGVPQDRSHTEIDPLTGMQKDYIVLSEEERAKGFIKPVRRSYVHEKCGVLTTMGRALAETYARDPYFYSGTFCCTCGAHFGLEQFHWTDGEPMDPLQQADWAQEQKAIKEDEEFRRQQEVETRERAELARLKAKYEPEEKSV